MVASAGGYEGRRNSMKMMEEHLLLPMYITILARAVPSRLHLRILT